jgi:DNA invertase Pin-like site-specific DNA recombinase
MTSNSDRLLTNIEELIRLWKRAERVDNAHNSLAKATANGNKIGRKRIRNNDEIKKLRSEGLTYREIASKIGLSTAAVQRGLKDE